MVRLPDCRADVSQNKPNFQVTYSPAVWTGYTGRMTLTCFKCKRCIAGHTKQIFVHSRAVHHINSSATYFQCCEQGCGRTFSFIRSFRRHLIKHEGEHDLIEVPEDDPNARHYLQAEDGPTLEASGGAGSCEEGPGGAGSCEGGTRWGGVM